MEKGSGITLPLPPQPDTTRCRGSRRRFRVAALLAGIVVLGCLTNLRLFSYRLRSPVSEEPHSVQGDHLNPWESITPSPELEWHPCYTSINPSFLCARFTVPMDYTSSSSSANNNSASAGKVHIALLLLPSQTHNHTQTHSSPTSKLKQPLLLNPGGPGGSGVALALLGGPALQKVLGPDQPILGFDPRGVGFTVPRADCWAAPPPPSCKQHHHHHHRHRTRDGGGDCEEDVAGGMLRRLQWESMTRDFGGLNESDVATRLIDAGHRGVNRLCGEKDRRLKEEGGSSSILGHASTQHVARDMKGIVDAWERWVGKHGAGEDAEEGLKGKLVYWGFSYGTYLGATFARMFPERVGRVVLDGVVDGELYETPLWRESLVDADKVLGELFRYCVEAGRKCDLYRNGDTAQDVKRRYDEVMDRLETSPVTFTHPEHFYPVFLRNNFVKQLVFTTLYSPVKGFPGLATVLNIIYEGKYELLGALFQDAQLLCTVAGNPLVTGTMTDAQRAIMCGDKTQSVNMTLPEIRSGHEALAATSQFGDIWMELMLKCNGWDIYPSHPLPATELSKTNKQIETTHPILLLSNTYDPVTPLRAAVKTALQFKDAGLVEQQSLGHCTISTVSRCMAKVLREYFTTGKVPPPPRVDGKEEFKGEWTRCGVDEVPWGAAGPDRAGVETVEEREMLEGWRALQTIFWRMQRWATADREGGPDMEAVMSLARSS
ncbi:TAP-like protein-domain-containing protein [Chaetomium strumarium]|uniref:TAP-like protein-domain-containing protein n=1 Tax=Chaetomium strumarium TaxID=1170767 RepID=A0AAJ0GSA5_9PEZI|nr:TAP-like protein-domain-containing protein [Chaetomium strumarium]